MSVSESSSRAKQLHKSSIKRIIWNISTIMQARCLENVQSQSLSTKNKRGYHTSPKEFFLPDLLDRALEFFAKTTKRETFFFNCITIQKSISRSLINRAGGYKTHFQPKAPGLNEACSRKDVLLQWKLTRNYGSVRPSSDNLLRNEEIVSSLFILLFNITKPFDRVLKLLNAQIFNHKRDICLNNLEHLHPTSCSFDKKEMICHARCSLYHTGILLFL